MIWESSVFAWYVNMHQDLVESTLQQHARSWKFASGKCSLMPWSMCSHQFSALSRSCTATRYCSPFPCLLSPMWSQLCRASQHRLRGNLCMVLADEWHRQMIMMMMDSATCKMTTRPLESIQSAGSIWQNSKRSSWRLFWKHMALKMSATPRSPDAFGRIPFIQFMWLPSWENLWSQLE